MAVLAAQPLSIRPAAVHELRQYTTTFATNPSNPIKPLDFLGSHYTEKMKSSVPTYKNPSAPAARRVKDLLARMTLEEKAAQMMCVWQQKADTLVDAGGNFDAAKAKAAFKQRRGLGQVGRPSDAGKGKDARGMAELTNAIQKFFVEN